MPGKSGSRDGAGGAGLDVSTAAVWAYYHGYLRVLLAGPPLSERLSKLAAGDQLASCRQLLLLCPSAGQLPEDADRLTEDGRLTSVGRADTFSQSVAGARSRQYGGHPVFRLTGRAAADSAESPEQRLAAVEAVGSLRTLRVVVEAMARCPRQLPPLDVNQLVGQFVTRLRDTVTRDDRLRDAFRVVEYDARQRGALETALQAAAFGDAGSTEQQQQQPATAAPLPGGVGVYLAWSFVHGYLALTAGRRDLAGELTRLGSEAALPLPLPRVVVLCPTTTDWSDDISLLDGQLKPVRDVDGVEAGVPALAGRRYGGFSIYCSSQEDSSCFALELATPLRTLRLGVADAGLDQQVYRREAVSFIEELQQLVTENPAVAAHYSVLRVDADTSIHQELDKLAATFRPA